MANGGINGSGEEYIAMGGVSETLARDAAEDDGETGSGSSDDERAPQASA